MRIWAVFVTRTLSSNIPTTSATCSPCSRMPRSSSSSTTRLMSSGPPAIPVPIRSARGVQAELLVVDDCGGVEFLRQVAGGEGIGAIKALFVGQAFVLDLFQDASVLPAEGMRLVPARYRFSSDFILPSRPSALASSTMSSFLSIERLSQSSP